MLTLDDVALKLDVSRETLAPLEVYADLLVKWQKAKNLVATNTIPEMWQRHFLDSAQLVPLIGKNTLSKETTLLDIGSGGGFPGLVLAALLPLTAHMIEANGRKCSFMSEVARKIAPNVEIHPVRIENLKPFPADVITSRACANLNQLLGWAFPFSTEKTVLWFLKGEKVEEELTDALSSWNMAVVRHPSLSSTKGIILEIRHLEKR